MKLAAHSTSYQADVERAVIEAKDLMLKGMAYNDALRHVGSRFSVRISSVCVALSSL